MTKQLRPAKYTAIALILQCAPAIAQEQQPEPKPEKPDLIVVVSAAVCGDPGLSIAGKPGALALVGPDGRVIKTGTDLTIVNAWLKGCPKEGGAK